jgi:cathepsin B
MVSCDKLNLGCNGGILPVAWFYLLRKGIPTEECLPYTSSEGVRGACPKTCVDGSEPRFFRTKSIKTFRNTDDVKLDILANGPVETGFMVYEDFMGYESGIYSYTEGNLLGGHAVKVIGWGVENGTKYWIAANSWSEKWGENGFFKIEEGTCKFDNQFIAGSVRL